MVVTPFWHPDRKGDWRAFAKSLGPFFIVVTCTLWALLPIFWGSTLLLEHYFYRLNIFVVDFDSQAVGAQNALAGPPITQSLIMLNSKVGPHLTYQVVPPAHFPGGPSQVMEAVGHNEAWGAVVINGNATTAWRSAIENGDAAYDPTGSVGVYFSGAHFYQIVLLYVAPIMKTNVVTALIEASDAAARTFLQTAISANNATAVSMAARAPQTLGNVFGMFTYDVRPITAWASAAPMEAGLIYNIIFAFHLTLLSAVARLQSGLNKRLTTGSLLKVRLAVPAFCYFWFSLWYALIVRAYQVPLDTSVGRAGFVVFWMLNYVSFMATGFALEAFLSLLTLRWFPFSLMFWIILNITSSFLPLELMQPFYFWGYAWPFRLNVQASKLIFYDTEPQHYLGRYFGGLIAWALAGIVSICAAQLLDRWRIDRSMRAAAASKKHANVEADEKAPSHRSNDDAISARHDETGADNSNSSSSGAEDTMQPQGAAAAASAAPPDQQQKQHQQQARAQPLAASSRAHSGASGRSVYVDAE